MRSRKIKQCVGSMLLVTNKSLSLAKSCEKLAREAADKMDPKVIRKLTKNEKSLRRTLKSAEFLFLLKQNEIQRAIDEAKNVNDKRLLLLKRSERFGLIAMAARQASQSLRAVKETLSRQQTP